MKNLPKSRSKNIIVQNLEEEVLIYDLSTNKAFCLNETSARVYNACDGETSVDELKSKYKFTDDLIYLSLDELKRAKLLDEKTDYVSSLAGISRREAVRRVGLATLIALPLISSLIAPTAANAQSGGVGAACVTGVCFPAGSDLCAGGCRNMAFTITIYDSVNGSCSGMITYNDPSGFSCGPALVTSGGDFIRHTIL